MGGAVKITRTDMSAKDLRCVAKRTKNGRVVRRLLAIAMVLDGVDRATAARSSGMDCQTLRDWVHRYNATGIEGLSDLGGKGAKPRLTPEQQGEYPKAWGNCFVLLNLAGILDARTSQDLSTQNSSSRDQPYDLAEGSCSFIGYTARPARHYAGGDGMGEYPSFPV